MYVDSHCHLNFPELRKNLPEILTNMHENQVTQTPNIGEQDIG